MKWLYLAAIGMILSSCGAPKEITVRDTIIQIRERVLIDTVPILKDTVIWKDSVWVDIKYIPTPLGKQLQVTAKCPPQEIKLQTVTRTKTKTEMDRTGWLVAIALGLVLLLSLRR